MLSRTVHANKSPSSIIVARTYCCRVVSRYSSGHMGRRAMLRGRLRVVSAAHKRLDSILHAEIINTPRTAARTASGAAASTARRQKEDIGHTTSDAAFPVRGEAGPIFTAVNARTVVAANKDGIDWNNRQAALIGDMLNCATSDDGKGTAKREGRIVLWALRDVAARIIQEEVRHYARTRFMTTRTFLEDSSVVAVTDGTDDIVHIDGSDLGSRDDDTPDTNDCTALAARTGRASSGFGDWNRAAGECVVFRGEEGYLLGERDADEDAGRSRRGWLLPSEKRKRR